MLRALLVTSGALAFGSAPLRAAPDLRTILVTGDPVPGGPEGETIRWIGSPPSTGDALAITGDRGDVGFVAGWGASVFEPHGVFVDEGGLVRRIAERGEMAPGTAVPFDFFPGIFPASPHPSGGRVAFAGGVTPDTTPISGLWSDRTGSLELVFLDTDHPPDTPPGYGFFQWVHALRGDAIVVNARYGTHINEHGFWRDPGTGFETIALTMTHAPGTPEGVVFGNGTELALGAFQNWDLDDAARIAFHAMIMGSGVGDLNDEGIWSEGAAGLSLLAREGDPAPGDPGAVYLGYQGFRTFGHGNVPGVLRSGTGYTVFGAQTDVPGNTYPGAGIYSDRTGTVERIALGRPAAESPDGEEAPGFPAGVTFTTFLAARITDAGVVAINGGTTSGALAIWWDLHGALERVVTTGDGATGLPAGWTLTLPVLIGVTDPGYMYVSSSLDTPSGTRAGVFLVLPTGEVQLVAATGLGYEVRPGDVRTVGTINRGAGIGDGGQITLELEFGDGSEALIQAAPSEVVAVSDGTPSARRVPVSVYPNPFRFESVITIRGEGAGPLVIAVFDATGRRVRTLESTPSTEREVRVFWDGRDDAGRRLSPGVYFVRTQRGAAATVTKLILSR